MPRTNMVVIGSRVPKPVIWPKDPDKIIDAVKRGIMPIDNRAQRVRGVRHGGKTLRA